VNDMIGGELVDLQEVHFGLKLGVFGYKLVQPCFGWFFWSLCLVVFSRVACQRQWLEKFFASATSSASAAKNCAFIGGIFLAELVDGDKLRTNSLTQRAGFRILNL